MRRHEGYVFRRPFYASAVVFFASHGEMASNPEEDHEVGRLALNLLQNCMVYVNTMMIRTVLALPHGQVKFTPRDHPAPAPLIWTYLNR